MHYNKIDSLLCTQSTHCKILSQPLQITYRFIFQFLTEDYIVIKVISLKSSRTIRVWHFPKWENGTRPYKEEIKQSIFDWVNKSLH